MGNAEQAQRFIGKEFTAEDFNNPNKYDLDIIKGYFEDTVYTRADETVSLIEELVTMIRNNESSTLEFISLYPGGYNDIIYRDKRSESEYIIHQHHDDTGRCIKVIKLTKDNKYVYRFHSKGEMRGYFHLQDQITELQRQVSSLKPSTNEIL